MYASRESREEAFMNKITTVKELPDSEKPYEKFLTYGPEYLSDTRSVRPGNKRHMEA